MSFYLYVCYGWPNSGLIKVGKALDPARRCFVHFPISVIHAAFELPNAEQMDAAELGFHRLWQGLAVRQIGGLCESYNLDADEAVQFLRLFLAAEFPDFIERSDLKGATTARACKEQTENEISDTRLNFLGYTCGGGRPVYPSTADHHNSMQCVPSREHEAALQALHRRSADALL